MGVGLWPEVDDTLVPATWFTSTPASRGEPAPEQWADWLRALFPRHVTHKFAPRHQELWRWVWAIQAGQPADPFVAVWSRGGGKSTTAEMAAAALGVRGQRLYCLYVRDTQDRADDSVANIGALLESPAMERYYPSHSEPAVNKFGHSKGWRRNRLRTAGGFTVDAIGLDVAARGAKLEDQRPDLLIFDDIDGRHDSPAVTQKKLEIITTSLLPARAPGAAVLVIQNLIHRRSIVTQLASDQPPFLTTRILSGPHPALLGMQWAWRTDPETGVRKPVITAGEPTWSGQDFDQCQRDIASWGPSAFLAEAQHDVFGTNQALALRYAKPRHTVTGMDRDAKRALVKRGRVSGGIDFGAYRFAWQLSVMTPDSARTVLEEVFSQQEGLEARARTIHARCVDLGVPPTTFFGDSANPQDITELNIAFQRIGSPYRVAPVVKSGQGQGAFRQVAVERINDLLDRGLLRFADTLGDGQRWALNRTASSHGQEMQGSRLLWEIGEWSYPVPTPGEPQSQDPDDATADGADAIAALRYDVMSTWQAPKDTTRPLANEDVSFGVNLTTGKPIDPKDEYRKQWNEQRSGGAGRSSRSAWRKPRRGDVRTATIN